MIEINSCQIKTLNNIYFCTWSSKNQSKLMKHFNKEKEACRIILCEEMHIATGQFMTILKILMSLNLLFMFKIKQKRTTKIFFNQFSNIQPGPILALYWVR